MQGQRDTPPLGGVAAILASRADDPERRARAARAADFVHVGAALPPQDPAAVARILAAGRRDFGAVDRIWPAHEAHARAVRAAYMEGAHLAADGFLSDADIARAYQRSRALQRVHGTEAAGVIGRRVSCDDPRAAGYDWTLAALFDRTAWLRTPGHDLIVGADAVRLVTGEQIA